jgi:hypothetical protein
VSFRGLSVLRACIEQHAVAAQYVLQLIVPVSGRKGEYRLNGQLIGYHRFDTSGCPADNSHHA